MQRPLDLAGRDFLFGNARFRKGGIRHDPSVTLEPGVKPLNPFEHRRRHFDRRQLLRLYLLPNLNQSQVTKICRHSIAPRPLLVDHRACVIGLATRMHRQFRLRQKRKKPPVPPK
jgi:hypothetical protein